MLTMDDYIFHPTALPQAQALAQSTLFTSNSIVTHSKVKYLTGVDDTALLEPTGPH